MQASFATWKPDIVRLPTPINTRLEITDYDVDNLYPQRVEQVMFRSPITSSAVEAKADFLNGEGFENNGDLVINDKGQTINDVLDLISVDMATFKGYALHIHLNGLGEIVELFHVPFKYVRYGLPDENGEHYDVKISPNWEDDPKKLPNRKRVVESFPLFKFGMDLSVDDIDGGKGFILYYVPLEDYYPRATFDPVLDSAQTQGEIQVFELGNIQNGFLGASVFKHPGPIESESERNNLKNKLGEMKGAGNANSILLVETPDEYPGSPLIENIPALNQDTLFDQTNRNVVNRIVQAYGMPPSVLGLMPESGMFNQQEIQDSFDYYNIRTQSERMRLERVFAKIAASFESPVELGDIIPKAFKSTRSPEPETQTDEDGQTTD